MLVDDLTVTWRRVPYGVTATVDKIKSIPELHDSLGERLPLGR